MRFERWHIYLHHMVFDYCFAKHTFERKEIAPMNTITFSRIFKRHAVVMLAVVGVMCAGSIAHAGSVPCVLDGYAAMGGMVLNTSNNYLLGGDPNSEPTGGMETWGYGWLKFDGSQLPDEAVSSAVLQLQSITQESGGMFTPPEAVSGGISVNIYSVTDDVATITNAATAGSFRSSFSTLIDTATVTGGDGVYEWDVTDLVNQWIAGPSGDGSFGLVFTATDAIPKFHASETTTGAAPVIQFTAANVPEPSTLVLALTACGLFGAGSLLRRSRRRDRESA